MKKHLFTAFLFLFLACLVFAAPAFAEEDSGNLESFFLYRNSPSLDPQVLESDDSCYWTEGWKWDADSRTLTLKNANLDKQVYLPKDSTVILIGDNKVTRLDAFGDMTITGSGRLETDFLSTSLRSTPPIPSTVTIKRAEVLANDTQLTSLVLRNGASFTAPHSLQIEDGFVLADDSTLNVEASDDGYALYAKDIVLIDSTVTVDEAQKAWVPVCAKDDHLFIVDSLVTVSGKAVSSPEDIPLSGPDGKPFTTGWNYIPATGEWCYLYENGWRYVGLLEWNGDYYYLDPYMLTNIYFTEDNIARYFDAYGVMQTGWVQPFLNQRGGGSDRWVYFNEDGSKADRWFFVDGHWYFQGVGATGILAIGWQEIGGEYYYFDESGAMLADTVVDGYVLAADGRWIP